MLALKRVDRDASRLHHSLVTAMQDLQRIDDHESRKRTCGGAQVSSCIREYEPELGTFQPPPQQLMSSGENFEEWKTYMVWALPHFDYVTTGVPNDTMVYSMTEWEYVLEEILQAILVSIEPALLTSLGQVDTAHQLWISICEKFHHRRNPSTMSYATDSSTTERRKRCLLLSLPVEILQTILSHAFFNPDVHEWGPLPSYHEKADVMATCRTLYDFVRGTQALWRFLPTRARKGLIKKTLSYNVRKGLDIEFDVFRDDECLLLVIDQARRWESLYVHQVSTEDWERMLGILCNNVFGPPQPFPNVKKLRLRSYFTGYDSEADAKSVLCWVNWKSIESLEMDGGPIPTGYPDFTALRMLKIHDPSEDDVDAIYSLVRMLQQTPNLDTLYFRGKPLKTYDPDDVRESTVTTDLECAVLPRLQKMNVQLLYDETKEKGVFTQLELLSRKLTTPALVSLTIAQEIWAEKLRKETFEEAVQQINNLFATKMDARKVEALSLSFLSPLGFKSKKHATQAKVLGVMFVREMLTRFQTAKRVAVYMLDPIPVTDILARAANAIVVKLWSEEAQSYRDMDEVVQWLYRNKRRLEGAEQKPQAEDADGRREENTLFIRTDAMHGRVRVPGQRPMVRETKEQWAGSTWLIWESYE